MVWWECKIYKRVNGGGCTCGFNMQVSTVVDYAGGHGLGTNENNTVLVDDVRQEHALVVTCRYGTCDADGSDTFNPSSLSLSVILPVQKDGKGAPCPFSSTCPPACPSVRRESHVVQTVVTAADVLVLVASVRDSR